MFYFMGGGVMTLRYFVCFINFPCVYMISLCVCIDIFVFQMGVASVNQLKNVIGPAKHLALI